MRQVVTGTRLTQVCGTIRVTVQGTCLHWRLADRPRDRVRHLLRVLFGDIGGDRVRILPVLGLGAHLGDRDRHAPHDRAGLRACRRCRRPSCSTFPGRSGKSVTGTCFTRSSVTYSQTVTGTCLTQVSLTIRQVVTGTCLTHSWATNWQVVTGTCSQTV